MAKMTLRDYTSFYTIKEFLANQIAPKYFDLANIEDSNVGLFGYVTEILGDNVEDSFFATTMLFKEIFPVTAEDPESIHLMAALFQMSSHFATPSKLSFNILIAEDDVISHSTYADGFYSLDIDRDMLISVDNLPFMLDYDVHIMSKKTAYDPSTGRSTYTHTAYYIKEGFDNPLSQITSVYIPTRVHTHTENNKRYVLLTVDVHQVNKTTTEDTVLTNDKINVVTKEYGFSGQLANFEIYYRESNDDAWIQMKKFVSNSTSISKDPSYYYKFIDDNKIAINFNSDERYFIPKFNSQLKIEMYTTEGADGNFEKYTGEDLSISGVSTKYASNKGLIFIGNVRGAAKGGYDAKSIEELRKDVIKAFSTVKSFNTASDLTLYFNSLRLNQNNELLIIKQRDDALKRLFSSYVLFKDDTKNIVPTNTVDIHFDELDIDESYPQTNRYVMNAGKMYSFDEGSTNVVHLRPDLDINSDLDIYEGKEYIYINPFLTVLGVNPTLVGYYVNTINDSVIANFKDVNMSSFNQFIVNSVDVVREGLAGDKEYSFTVKLYPSSKLPAPAFEKVNEDTYDHDDPPSNIKTFINDYDGFEYIDNGIIDTVLMFEGVPDKYMQLELCGFDADCYHMKGKLKTNDYISLNNKIQIIEGLKDIETGEEETDPVLLTSYETKATVYTFLKYDDSTTAGLHKFRQIPDLAEATLTNEYETAPELNFVIPVPEIISTLKYVDNHDGTYSFKLLSVPMVKANVMKSTAEFNSFLANFRSMYEYLEAAMDQLVNNFDIDLKFFNTYGPARHFYYYDKYGGSGVMDKINITLRFGIKFSINNGIENAVAEVKDYIKSYVESDEVSLISAPSLFISNLIRSMENSFQSIAFIVFKGLNDYDENIQRFESEVNDINVLEGSFATRDVIPEYLTIDQIITKGIKTPQIIIDVI